MDELLQKAIARRDQLRTELAALENFIRSYSDAKDRQVQPKGAAEDLFDQPKTQRFRRKRAAETVATMDKAEKLIIEAGRPLTRTSLLKGLQEAGFSVDGGDKSKVLGTNLWRSRRFYNLKRAGYWPISTPIPEEFKRFLTRDSMLRVDDQK